MTTTATSTMLHWQNDPQPNKHKVLVGLTIKSPTPPNNTPKPIATTVSCCLQGGMGCFWTMKTTPNTATSPYTATHCTFITRNKPSLNAYLGNSARKQSRVSALYLLIMQCKHLFRHCDASQHMCLVPEPIVVPSSEATHMLLAKDFSTSAVKMSNQPTSSAPKCKVCMDLKKLAQLKKVTATSPYAAAHHQPTCKPLLAGVDGGADNDGRDNK
ncbi:hypothetical protein F5148DRAFT_1146851 [Russula earlei]|uniref:Uncharacterized protein n=1 Tax=Russula earlei TaxID=71964 RepID=A0ACC0UII8_9AGAM|nr:hypothetical protein F5148DRAFT_1146851 [Russula earlei]